ncbi:MAG: 50S ribosomal protein L22 [Terriglobia bacterium]
MKARATSKYLRVSPQKARLVIDLIRGKPVGEAISVLRFTKKRITHEIEKTLRSAIANAEQKNENVDVDDLVISEAYVNEGPRTKRIRPAPMGRAYRYQRRTSHVTVVVHDAKP